MPRRTLSPAGMQRLLFLEAPHLSPFSLSTCSSDLLHPQPTNHGLLWLFRRLQLQLWERGLYLVVVVYLN